MGCQDGVTGIRHKEVCVLWIDHMHVCNSIDFYSLLEFVIHILLLDKLRDLLMYLSLSVIRSIVAEILHVCQTVGFLIGKCLPICATTDDTASYVSLPEIVSSYEI